MVIERLKILIFEPAVEVARVLDQRLSERYTVLMSSTPNLFCQLFECRPTCFALILIEGGHHKGDLSNAKSLIEFVRAKGYKGIVVVMASDPAYPYERIGADRVVGFMQLVDQIAEILAKK